MSRERWYKAVGVFALLAAVLLLAFPGVFGVLRAGFVLSGDVLAAGDHPTGRPEQAIPGDRHQARMITKGTFLLWKEGDKVALVQHVERNMQATRRDEKALCGRERAL